MRLSLPWLGMTLQHLRPSVIRDSMYNPLEVPGHHVACASRTADAGPVLGDLVAEPVELGDVVVKNKGGANGIQMQTLGDGSSGDAKTDLVSVRGVWCRR